MKNYVSGMAGLPSFFLASLEWLAGKNTKTWLALECPADRDGGVMIKSSSATRQTLKSHILFADGVGSQIQECT